MSNAHLEAFKPLFFVAENVGGILSSGNRKDFQIIVTALEGAGYDVFYKLFKFEDYGVPQKRHRVILVGFRRDLQIYYKHPEPTTKDQHITVGEALNGIADDAYNHEKPRHSEKVIERLRHILPGENAYTAALPEHLKLDRKSPAQFSQTYKRLEHDKPAYTITASGGDGTLAYHWTEPRALTNRELARIQTFPDDYWFSGGREAVRKQIGMAVPPAVSEIIFNQVLKTLVENDVEPHIVHTLTEEN